MSEPYPDFDQGYGKSTARKNFDEYAMETVNKGMLALLEHLGREKAVWIGEIRTCFVIVFVTDKSTGHDWGCGCVWSFVAHYPEKTVAAAGMCVPYAMLEYGLEELLASIDRKIYPEDDYPYGQWSYQKFYEIHFEKSVELFEHDIRAVLRALRTRGNPDVVGKPAITANVVKDGGWFGGQKPDAAWRDIPIQTTVFEDEESFDEFASAMEKTGFWGGDAYYANHGRNRKYALEKRKNDGYLDMPVLFIHATYDTVCGTFNDKVCTRMRQLCRNLKENTIDASHWVAEEKPMEVNAVLAKWLVEKCPEYWPAKWSSHL
jgi:soluble epoxide hydrolase/lipid-phosphate phosphatase